MTKDKAEKQLKYFKRHRWTPDLHSGVLVGTNGSNQGLINCDEEEKFNVILYLDNGKMKHHNQLSLSAALELVEWQGIAEFET